MNRKHFLKTIVPAAAITIAGKKLLATPDSSLISLSPPNYLKTGDTIGITCPGGPLKTADAQNCFNTLQAWGFRVKAGKTVGSHWERFGGTDDERIADLQMLLDDDNVKAILFGRGGYGVMRIMDKINWDRFVKNPKWLIGFSDITALHCHIHTIYGIPTIHADMVNGFTRIENETAHSLRNAITGGNICYDFEGSELNRSGQAKGKLVGGNLSLIYAMQASKSELKTEGKILLIEDVNEYKYTVDRMLMNLKRSGKLDNLAGLVVGGFTGVKKDIEHDFTMQMEDLVYEKVHEYNYPVCFHFPAGHQRTNLAIKLGIYYNLSVDKTSATLGEAENQHQQMIQNPAPNDSISRPDSANTPPGKL